MSTDPALSNKIINEEIQEDHKPMHALSQANNLQVSGCSGLFKDSYREELHIFYEEKQGKSGSLSNFRDSESVPSHGIRHSKCFSLPRANSYVGSETSVQTSYHSSGYTIIYFIASKILSYLNVCFFKCGGAIETQESVLY